MKQTRVTNLKGHSSLPHFVTKYSLYFHSGTVGQDKKCRRFRRSTSNDFRQSDRAAVTWNLLRVELKELLDSEGNKFQRFFSHSLFFYYPWLCEIPLVYLIKADSAKTFRRILSF